YALFRAAATPLPLAQLSLCVLSRVPSCNQTPADFLREDAQSVRAIRGVALTVSAATRVDSCQATTQACAHSSGIRAEHFDHSQVRRCACPRCARALFCVYSRLSFPARIGR